MDIPECNTISMAVLSDVHLGHSRTPTKHIVNNLNAAFPDSYETAELDMIVIAGDLFDKAMCFSNVDITHIQLWAIRLLKLCAKYDITLRILEGTPLHDRNQSRHIITLNEGLNKKADVKYIPELSIERIDRLGISVLYVPDEWQVDPNHTWNDVKQALGNKSLTSVDIAVMHGMFEHQLPPGVNLSTHIAKRYESVVNKYIFIGHVHHPSVKGKIVAPGSFDRLKHGEEEAKGHWRAKVNLSSDTQLGKLTFVENKETYTYLSIDCRELTFEASQKAIRTACTDIGNGSHIRLLLSRDGPNHAVLKWTRETYPALFLTNIITDKSPVKINDETFITYQPVAITRRNIMEQLKNKMVDKGVDQSIQINALEMLNEIIVK